MIEGLGRTKVKIIIITVHNTFAYAQKALRLGACDIITKPIGISQLREAFVRAVGWNYTDNETLNQALRYMYLHYAENINLNSLAESTCCTTATWLTFSGGILICPYFLIFIRSVSRKRPSF